MESGHVRFSSSFMIIRSWLSLLSWLSWWWWWCRRGLVSSRLLIHDYQIKIIHDYHDYNDYHHYNIMIIFLNIPPDVRTSISRECIRKLFPSKLFSKLFSSFGNITMITTIIIFNNHHYYHRDDHPNWGECRQVHNSQVNRSKLFAETYPAKYFLLTFSTKLFCKNISGKTFSLTFVFTNNI